MFDRVNTLLLGILFLALLFVASGCPKPTPTPQGDAASKAPGGAKGQQQSKTGESGTGAGSLAERREGKPEQPGPLKEVYFAYDSFDLRPDARATLKTSADWLKANPAARVEIEGHCDERGTNEYNLALGAKRAQAAKDYLVTLGIAAGRLSTISYGEELPLCKEQSEGCWQKNRRDRFVVTSGRPAS